MSKVSVIIPTYNTPLKYLKEAVYSALNQTRKPDEILVIDDGSNEIVTFDIKGITTYRLERNRGIGFVRNLGIKLAKGDFIAFISADDLMNDNFIETMLAYAKSYPDSIFYSDFEVIGEDGKKIHELRVPEFNDYNQFVQACVEAGKGDRMFVCYNIFAPAKLLKENNFDPEKTFGEDLEHLLRCLVVKKINFVHVPFMLFKYREHRKMVTQQRWNEIHENNLDTFKRINKLIGKNIL